MANYIKIRDLTPYPANEFHTGVYSGDMFAMALNTTGPGSPHPIDGTQRASVRQVIESYNTTVAQNSAPAEGAAPGQANQQPVIKDNDPASPTYGLILDGGPSLTPSTFASYVTIGGGLDYSETCDPDPDDPDRVICTYGLSLATSASSTTFYAVVSGGAVAPAGGYAITSNGWISGRFPNLGTANAWVNTNISSAKNLYYLVAGDIKEEIYPTRLNISNSDFEAIRFLDYGAFAMVHERNDNVAANSNQRWVQGYGGYLKNDIIQFTGTNAGYIGDWNLYRATAANANTPETDGVIGGGWERMTPAMTTGLIGTDPNGFLANNPLFENRASVTFDPKVDLINGTSYGWFSHGGETFFSNLKLIFNDINNSAYNGGTDISRIFRKGVGNFLSLGPGLEMHLHGRKLGECIEVIGGASLRIYGNANWALMNVPDPWNKTGSAGVNCPIPALYISTSGMTGEAALLTTGLGSFVLLSEGSQALLGNEYYSQSVTFTRNSGHEGSRMQWGSGQNNITAMVEAISASRVGGNTNMAMSPTTTFNPGGVNLSITGYSAPGHEGLGYAGSPTYAAYPNIAPIAARQFISNNTSLTSYSGAPGTSASVTSTYLAWVGTIDTSIASGDAFNSSKHTAPYASTSVVAPATSSIGLSLYERYPDSLPPVGLRV